jgi:BirA family transcriptional regulator, biotin operon repressor / biotin---[acetyl-CoA-carboxylase] ligase
MWNILEFSELGSTNTLASEMLARGEAKHGDVIQAHHQSGGRGRAAGRVWNDEPETSLLMSIVLAKIPEPANLLQYRAALAVISAFREIVGTSKNDFRLKWPNDILLNGKKICGILLEAQWNGSVMRSAIIGIGINVSQSKFPEELDAIATSLRLNNMDIPVNDVRDAVLDTLKQELENADDAIISRLREELTWMATLPSLQWSGSDGTSLSNIQYENIDEQGALRLRLLDGSTVMKHSGSLFVERSTLTRIFL